MTSGQFPDLLRGDGAMKKRVPKAVLRTKQGKEKVARVMKEFKQNKLRSSSGQKVSNPKQAIAIALSEAYRKVKGQG
jgi:Trm5-related predicted tRNA methylase